MKSVWAFESPTLSGSWGLAQKHRASALKIAVTLSWGCQTPSNGLLGGGGYRGGRGGWRYTKQYIVTWLAPYPPLGPRWWGAKPNNGDREHFSLAKHQICTEKIMTLLFLRFLWPPPFSEKVRFFQKYWNLSLYFRYIFFTAKNQKKQVFPKWVLSTPPFWPPWPHGLFKKEAYHFWPPKLTPLFLDKTTFSYNRKSFFIKKRFSFEALWSWT